MKPRRPTREQILAAEGRTIPDLIAPRLRVLFCGINPGLYSAAVGYPFARPGNRFWRALHAGGFTERVLEYWEADRLLRQGLGITDLVSRATATADGLIASELVAGGRRLERKVRRYAPRWVAILGLGAFRTAFARPTATIGRQKEPLGPADVWVLPSPSGLNASYPLPELTRAFRALRAAVARPGLRWQPD